MSTNGYKPPRLSSTGAPVPDGDVESIRVETQPATAQSTNATGSTTTDAIPSTSSSLNNGGATSQPAYTGMVPYSDGDFFDQPGKKGTYISFFLVVCIMIASVVSLKYAPENVESANWIKDCPTGYEQSCKANGAVLRFSFALSIIFACQFVLTTLAARLYDALWALKLLVFVAICLGFFFSDDSVFNQNGYAWFARIGGFFYLILQQIILLDFAYTWNESWVKKSDDDGGSCWKGGLLAVALILLCGSIAGIGLMYHFFSGCSDTTAIISITLVLSIISTTFQLFCTTEGSILTSAVMVAYFTYVCFSAISLNPDTTCNPTLAQSAQTLSAAIGMGITVLSLSWTTYTTITKIPQSVAADVERVSRANSASGIASTSVIAVQAQAQGGGGDYSQSGLRPLLQEVSIVFVLISCYYAMVLTNWDTLQSNYNIASSKIGQAAMWIQASAEWIAFLFYIWSLVAPTIWPERFADQ